MPKDELPSLDDFTENPVELPSVDEFITEEKVVEVIHSSDDDVIFYDHQNKKQIRQLENKQIKAQVAFDIADLIIAYWKDISFPYK